MFDGGGGDRDPFAPLLDELRAEMALYRKFLNDQTSLWLRNKDTWGKAFPAPCGTPLGPKEDARYEFWPQRKEELPLLFFCATQLLTGAKASTCSNERTRTVSSMSARTLPLGAFAQSCWALHFPAPLSSSRWPTTASGER